MVRVSCDDHAGLEKFEYAPDKEMAAFKTGDLILCEIEAKDLTTENIGIKERRLWGTDTYSNNSDLVAIAAHAGEQSTHSSLNPTHPAQNSTGETTHGAF